MSLYLRTNELDHERQERKNGRKRYRSAVERMHPAIPRCDLYALPETCEWECDLALAPPVEVLDALWARLEVRRVCENSHYHEDLYVQPCVLHFSALSELELRWLSHGSFLFRA